MPGLVLLEFGTDCCGRGRPGPSSTLMWRTVGFCRAAQRHLTGLLRDNLGRWFRVRLWPNFVLLKDGVVVRQLARPGANDLKEAFAAVTSH